MFLNERVENVGIKLYNTVHIHVQELDITIFKKGSQKSIMLHLSFYSVEEYVSCNTWLMHFHILVYVLLV
jgi:hypothetical protein